MPDAGGAWIPAHVLAADVSADAKILAGRIYALSKVDGNCYAGNDFFAEEFGISERTLQRWLRELINHAPPIIERQQIPTPKGGTKRRLYPVWPGSDSEATDMTGRGGEPEQMAFADGLPEATEVTGRDLGMEGSDPTDLSLREGSDPTDLSPRTLYGGLELPTEREDYAGAAGAPSSSNGLDPDQETALTRIWTADADADPRTLASYAVGFWMETRRTRPPESERKKQFEAFRRAAEKAADPRQYAVALYGVTKLWEHATDGGGSPWDGFVFERKFANALEAGAEAVAAGGGSEANQRLARRARASAEKLKARNQGAG